MLKYLLVDFLLRNKSVHIFYSINVHFLNNMYVYIYICMYLAYKTKVLILPTYNIDYR